MSGETGETKEVKKNPNISEIHKKLRAGKEGPSGRITENSKCISRKTEGVAVPAHFEMGGQ